MFPTLALLPAYQWDRIVLVPRGHELAILDRAPDIAELARHPLVTYVFSLTGEASFRQAFDEQGLEPDVVFTGEEAYDHVGVSVAGNFDFDLDGTPDILIGAEQMNRTAGSLPTGNGKV